MRRLLIIGLAAVFVTACGGGDTASDAAQVDETSSSVSSPAEVAGVARAIEAAPEATDSILSANGLTREEFDDLLYRIAMDPEQSRAYVEALGTDQ